MGSYTGSVFQEDHPIGALFDSFFQPVESRFEFAQAQMNASNHRRRHVTAGFVVLHFFQNDSCFLGSAGQSVGMRQRRQRFLLARKLQRAFERSDSFRIQLHLDINAAQLEEGGEEARFVLKQRDKLLDGAVILAGEKQRIGDIHVEDQRKGIEFPRTFLRSLRFLEAALGIQISCVPLIGRGIARIQLDSAEEFFFRRFPIPVVPKLYKSQ